jgi:hypothetical protein
MYWNKVNCVYIKGKKINILDLDLHEGNLFISVGKRDALYLYWLHMPRAVVAAQKEGFISKFAVNIGLGINIDTLHIWEIFKHAK